MKRKVLILLFTLLLALMVIGISGCGGSKDKEVQISYSGGRVGYDFHYTRFKTGNRIQEALDMFTSEGHHLIGFFTEDGLQYFDENGNQLDDILIEEDIHVISREAPNNYTVILNSGEGTFENEEREKSLSLVYGTAFPSIIVPSHPNPNFAFDGYYLEDTLYTSGNSLILDKFGSLENNAEIKLTAKYKIAEHTVKVNFNDGVTESTEIKVKHGDKLEIPKEYYLDNGEGEITAWSYSSYSTVPINEIITEDVTIFAVWTKYKKVVFDCGDLGKAEIKVHMIPGESVILPVNVIPGYRATAWYLNSVFSGNPVEKVPYGALNDTYYGKVEPTNYTVTFNTGYDLEIEPMTYSYGYGLELPVISREGYLFLGWEADREIYQNLSVTQWGDFNFSARYLKSTAISTPEDLELIRNNPENNYHLVNDIDLQGEKWTSIVELLGTIDGQGFKIHNFILECNEDKLGFILNNRGKIVNLSIDNVKIEYTTEPKEKITLGALCALNMGTIDSCKLLSSYYIINFNENGAITESLIGGLVGKNEATISGSEITTEISLNINNGYGGRIFVGGLVASNIGIIEDCKVYPKIVDNGTRRTRSSVGLHIGGAIATNDGEIRRTLADVDISSTVMKDDGWDNLYIGGLCAISGGSIQESLSKGIIKASYGKLSGCSVGGLVASVSKDGRVDNCYSVASIEANNLGEYCGIGGLVGSLSGVITYSYANNGTISANLGRIGGLVGSCGGDAFVRSSFSNYSCNFGVEFNNYVHCSFYVTGTNERDLFEVLGWDRDIWSLIDLLPDLSWNVGWFEIIVPTPPGMLEPSIPEESEPPLP